MNRHVFTETQSLPASIEILPKQTPAAAELTEILPLGIRVYLTDIGSADTDAEMLAAARRLRDAGLIPVPHLAARRLPSLSALETRIGRLAEAAGVTDMLVIGGGLSAPLGPFASSMDVLETGFLDRYGIVDLAIAGHPEGSPDFSEATATEALRLKRDFAERTNTRLRIVTQFGFDPERTLAWARNVRAGGVDIPIHIGVAGPAKITTLVKYGTMCGIGNSLSLLTRRTGSLMALATGYSPETFVAPIERDVWAGSNALISQFHVFPFGGLDKTSAWLRKRGSW
ncbi:methylenetetrahydrofolate reductase [Ensifer adhaerens]|uniref:methylenetetrahydrofolate reductase n=1 Tax=Ensifer adhaerens TaxID=106592 RepID=UPI003CFF0CD5